MLAYVELVSAGVVTLTRLSLITAPLPTPTPGANEYALRRCLPYENTDGVMVKPLMHLIA